MAKDDRTIHNGVTHEGTTFLPGMEDELAEAMSKDQINRLAKEGAISGNWGQTVDDDATAAKAAPGKAPAAPARKGK